MARANPDYRFRSIGNARCAPSRRLFPEPRCVNNANPYQFMNRTASTKQTPVSSIAREEKAARFGRPEGGWRLRLYTVIFESDTHAGRMFDLLLILTVMTSVAVVILDSV